MSDTQREVDEMELEAESEVDADFEAWANEFLGHRQGGTLQAPAPIGPNNPGPQAGQPEAGGETDTVGPTAGGSDLGGAQNAAPGPAMGGGSAPGGY